MHQRTWLSLLTLPLVAAFTYPVVVRQAADAPRHEAAGSAQDPLAGLSDIQDVLSLVRDNYVDPPDMEKAINGGIREALERAHPLNAYLSPEDLRLGDPGPASIGIRLIKRGIYAHVVSVTPGSSAAKAGIVVGDVVRKLDGDSVGVMSAWTLERRLRGPVGSELSLLRYGSVSGETKKIVVKRELPLRPAIAVRKEAKAVVVALTDLTAGRVAELKDVLAGLDHRLILVLDLRQCAGGTLPETALAAGLFVGAGPLGVVQETGRTDLPLAIVPAGLPPFAKLAVLQGQGTLGPAELLASALKKQGVPVFGERSAALGVERTRFTLKGGGAAEVVNKRWLGAGGEFLGAGGEKPEGKKAAAPAKGPESAGPKAPVVDAVKVPAAGYGVVPDHPLKGLKPEEDPLPKILEVLESGAKHASLGTGAFAPQGQLWLQPGPCLEQA
jgi:carboxyl-terminal processing protease